MAISPNVDFVAGAVLTATQQNQFPRGIMSYNEATAVDTSITTEEIMITSSAFTAVANRYYRITYFEPNPSGGTGYFTFRIRKGTTTAGTQLQSSFTTAGFGIERTGIAVWVGTLSAGSQQVIGTSAMSAGTGIVARGATYPAFLMVEDIGPA
jgi:hypothetical protein